MSYKRPSLHLLLQEIPHIALILVGRWRKVNRVDGVVSAEDEPPPIIVVPGLMSRDYSTSVLRRTLKQSGFKTYASKMGFMRGVTRKRMKKAEKRLRKISKRHGGPVILVGWSLGGLYARVLAQRHPKRVAMVVTLGSPFSGSRKANHAWRIYEYLNNHTVEAPPIKDDASVKPPVHTVAIWSKRDGVIAPASARGLPHERDVEIELEKACHMTFGAGRKEAKQIAAILATELDKARPTSTPQGKAQSQEPTNAVST